jgi:hypothetical protein
MAVLVYIDGPDCWRRFFDYSRHQDWVMPNHITHRLATFTRMKFALLFLALGLAGPASVGAQVKGAWHPMVFSMMESWISDVESPVVAEINLDAVQRNRNQFDHDAVMQEGAWVVYRVPGGGFKRYRVMEHNGNHYKVEFQDNGGGTLTTRSQIGFTLDQRQILVDGKPRAINTLRVISYSR